MNKGVSYEHKIGHKEDFKVKYKFYNESEGGRKTLPHQNIRSDFWYESDGHEVDWFFMIFPQFEDLDGNLISEGEVLKDGIARMWIVNDKLREYHQKRIKIGTIGYFKEGNLSTGKCEVVEIVSLMVNPTE